VLRQRATGFRKLVWPGPGHTSCDSGVSGNPEKVRVDGVCARRPLALVLTLLVTTIAAGCGGGAGSSGNKALTLGSIGWNENIAVSTLTQIVMQDDLGYDGVQVKGPLELGPLFEGVARGDLAAFQDVWLPNHQNYVDNPQIKTDVELLDPWYEGQTAYGIAVPDYMKNIQSLADLNHAGTDEITGIEPSAAFHPVIHNKVIPGYNLDMKLVESSTATMLSEVDKAYKVKEPIVFLAWSPHWMNAEYDFHYLDDPKGLEKPFSEPSRVTSVVNENLKDDDPQAYAFLKAISLDEAQVNELEAEINKAGADNPEKGVRNWLQDNQDVVEPWVKAAKEAA
jgi:glycine betaine/proline transport system substrate-binding protein